MEVRENYVDEGLSVDRALHLRSWASRSNVVHEGIAGSMVGLTGAMKLLFPKSGGPFPLLLVYLLILPITLPLGVAILVLALVPVVWPPCFVVILFVEGRWMLASLTLMLWGAVMYFLRHAYARLFARLFEGSSGL